mmetsp:Transcript_6625/g.16479  ORF Transcript_6625/g.16479 Transcript_6625/m.16479 type:complete len:208 (-) Transcript_6625:147-770(-)
MSAPSWELAAAGHHHHNQQHHMLLMSYEAPAGLGSGMMLLPGKGGGAACLLEHIFAMRQCLPRESPEAGVPAALLALLLPATADARALDCARRQAPACSAAAQGWHNFSVLSPRLLAPLADLRPADFAVHLAGCIGRRERPRPLRQCEGKLAALANLSRARGMADGADAKGSRGQMVEAREGGVIQGTEGKAAPHAPHGSSHLHEPK